MNLQASSRRSSQSLQPRGRPAAQAPHSRCTRPSSRCSAPGLHQALTLEKSILNTLEIVESVQKWSSWSLKQARGPGWKKIDVEHPGSRGKRGKMKLLVTENKLEERGRQTPTWKGWKGWGFGVQKFRFSTLSTISRVFKIDFGTRFLGPVFGFQELHFSTLSTLSIVRSSLLNPAPRARFWCPEAPFFHAFHVVRSRLNPAPRGWLFGPSQHPPGNPGKRGNGGSDLPGKEAGVRGPMVFFCGLVVDAITRSDTTRRWGQTTDLRRRGGNDRRWGVSR